MTNYIISNSDILTVADKYLLKKVTSNPKLENQIGNRRSVLQYYITVQAQPLRSLLLEDVGGLNPLIIASSKTDFKFF